jgi:hypothetical protein
MIARFRLRSGAKIELQVLDISAIGCMVDRRSWSAHAHDRVLVQLEGLGYQPAMVVWVEEERAGIAFEELLHEAVLERLKGTLARAA